MLGLGVYLLVAVSSPPSMGAPTAATARAEAEAATPGAITCTYDQAACDLADSGECAALDDAFDSDDAGLSSLPAVDASADRHAPPAPRLAEYLQRFVETCDMPRRASPGARIWLLRSARSAPIRMLGATAHAGAPLYAPTRPDDMPMVATLPPAPRVIVAMHPLFVNDPARPREAPASRLERPPSA